MKKIFLILLTAAFMFFVNAAGVYAADFDATYYAQRYPEVANKVGCGEKALYEHYLTIGQKEGKYPNAVEECAATARAIELQNAKATGNTAAVDALTKAQAATATASNAAVQVPVTTSVTQTPVALVPAIDPVVAAVQATGSYIDVDITNQTMVLYVNGLPVLTSPCVTGMPKNNRSTPKGAFYIMDKVPGKRLKGDTWDVWVDRWMRFTSDSVGLHDASWRKKFGGTIYKSNGSHGCVNLPKDVAYTLYDLVAVGTPVIVH